jgi:hypothetical protein
MKSVYSAVRTGSLNKAVCASSFKGYVNVYFLPSTSFVSKLILSFMFSDWSSVCNQIKRNEIGRACSTYVGEEGCFQGRRPLVRCGMNILEMWWEGTDWIDMAQDEDKRRAVVIAVMNVWVFIKWREFNNWRSLSLSEGTLLFEVCYFLFPVVVCPTYFIHRSVSMCTLLQSLINSSVYPRP